MIKSTFGINFKFHSIQILTIQRFLRFYKHLFRNWRKYLSSSVSIAYSILSQPIWYIKIDSNSIYVEQFPKENIIFLYDLFKGYPCKRTVISQNVSFEAQVKILFILQKSYVLLSRYSMVFHHPMIYQICDVMVSIST